MFLKSIELFGFKSFADRSKLEFSEGVSALLGPNGCGKSNIVDAVKWVLGEQASRSLRADRMEDVIFNGTESRKPLNVAEVSLTLSNDNGYLPIEVPEIVIKRRLYRSGESEYFLNSTPVKLKEIRELFYDTGIGKSAYSIMEQGKIDQVLSNKPEERRTIFEEAAGITKYKVKGQEAERKLEKTEENMRQIEGILGEVKRSYDALKTQSEKTLRYRTLREKTFQLELDIQLLRLKAFLEEKNKKEKLLEETLQKRNEIKVTIDKINESLEQHMDMVNSLESTLVENQKKLYGIGLEKESLEHQRRILAEQTGEYEAKLVSDTAQEKIIQEKIDSLSREILEKKRSLEEYQRRIQEIEKNIEAFEQSVHHAEERSRLNQQRIHQLEEEIRSLEGEDEALRNELRTVTDTIVSELDERLKESGYSYHEHLRLEQEVSTQLEGLKILIQGKLHLLEDSLKLNRTEADEWEKTIGAAVEGLQESVHRLEILSNLFKAFAASTPSFIDEFLAPEGIITKKRDIDERIVQVLTGIRSRREQIVELRTENAGLSRKIEEYRKNLEELRMNRVRIKTQTQGVKESVSVLEREQKAQEIQGKTIAEEIQRIQEKIYGLKIKQKELEQKRIQLEKDEEEIQKALLELEASISARNQDLVQKEQNLKSQMERLSQVQTSIEKIQMELAETATEIRNMYDNFRERHSRELSEFEQRIYEINDSVKDLREQLNEVREELKKLGGVNLMAPEEFAEVKERYDFLTSQLEDLRKAREDLQKVTREIRQESTALFLAAYEKIKKNFHQMFRRLFGGGRAELRLTDPDTVLESGIEILAQPPGKSLENIALLSGGERSLTAVALLFATYMVKPSPFCILDEIDAALDESNISRFVNMLLEFSANSQFIIITHNKKTVSGAKTLIGVTMEESGVSKIVSIRLDNKPEAVYV
ncbi:MAG TPA: AAA family ATPase [Spirochaetales bacterium]|nr:AAA family ATPase [Spirochaetales bacterium]